MYLKDKVSLIFFNKNKPSILCKAEKTKTFNNFKKLLSIAFKKNNFPFQ